MTFVLEPFENFKREKTLFKYDWMLKEKQSSNSSDITTYIRPYQVFDETKTNLSPKMIKYFDRFS